MRRLIELSRDSDLISLQNNETRAMALYVMQNTYGLIKIGRSASPIQRQQQLRQQGGCAVDLVATFLNAGHFEEWVHLHLAEHRVALEWFSGDGAARLAIEELFGKQLRWPYAFHAASAAAWIERLLDTGADRYWRRRERRVIKLLKSAAVGEGVAALLGDGHYQLDADIGLMMGYPTVCIDTRKGETIVTGWRDGDRKESEVPRYSRSLESAMTLWLPDVSTEQRGSYARPVDCCLAALCDRWGFDVQRLEPARAWR
jgi:hypothetical protein